MLKLTNPIYYPLAVALGGLTLILGVRFLRLSNFIMIPSALGVTFLSASVLKSRELDLEGQLQKTLKEELNEIAKFSENLGIQSEQIRQEVGQKLAQAQENLEPLIKVQEVCDRFTELPAKMSLLSRSMTQKKSLLSWESLTEKKAAIDEKINQSSGVHRQQLEQLSATLAENLQQIKQGVDSRQSQVIYLNNLLQAMAGNLQKLQNQLHNYNSQNPQTLTQFNDLLIEIEGQQDKLDQWLS